jgi:hypothetical protein
MIRGSTLFTITHRAEKAKYRARLGKRPSQAKGDLKGFFISQNVLFEVNRGATDTKKAGVRD